MIYEYLNHLISAVISTVVAAVVWLIRTVLTNQKQIMLLQNEIEERDKRRTEDREILKDLQSDVKEVKRDILELYKEKPNK
jgi:uncharacterized membrane protein (DUF106 family)